MSTIRARLHAARQTAVTAPPASLSYPTELRHAADPVLVSVPVDPLAQVLSDFLRDPTTSELRRARVRQIVSLTLANAREGQP